MLLKKVTVAFPAALGMFAFDKGWTEGCLRLSISLANAAEARGWACAPSKVISPKVTAPTRLDRRRSTSSSISFCDGPERQGASDRWVEEASALLLCCCGHVVKKAGRCGTAHSALVLLQDDGERTSSVPQCVAPCACSQYVRIIPTRK